MFAPHDSTSNLRSNSNPSRTVKYITSNPRRNRIRKSSVVMTFQIKPPGRYVHVVLSLFDKWPWIFVEFWGLPRWKNLFLFFPLFFFLVSIVLTSLFRLFYVTCELNNFLQWGWAEVCRLLEKMGFINLELREMITEQRLKWVPATIQEQTRIEV